MRSFALLVALLSVATFAACGDDGGGDDGGTRNTCPPRAPDRDGLSQPCCYRASNADRLDAPEFRVAGLLITSPPKLSEPLVADLLRDALDTERFNWLLRFDFSGSDARVTTGYGRRNADASFTFAMDDAPAPGMADRWNPVSVIGSLDGEVYTGPALDAPFTAPVFDETGTTIQIELPLHNLQLIDATMSEERTCVGTRNLIDFNIESGNLGAFLTVEVADAGPVIIGPLNTTLCMLVAGMAAEKDASGGALDCSEVPRDSEVPGGSCDGEDDPCDMANGGPGGNCIGGRCQWSSPPDSLCDGSGTCTLDPGDGSVCQPLNDCNAWRVTAGFAAQGVEITD